MPLLPPPHDVGGWRATRLRSLLPRRWRSAAGFAAAHCAPAAPPLVVLAVFAAVGVAVLDDYGVSVDEPAARGRGVAAIDYVLGDGPLLTDSDRYYGVSFEAPLLLTERLLGLTDSRAVHLLRHLLMHLFFLTGGFFCWLLAHRLFADRRLALFALLLYLLHPRLYGHSFFNPADVPFLAAFLIALWLVERAFRRDTAAAFALCGAGVGVLVDLRIMGVALFAAVPGLRALDLLQARGPAGRRRALATAAVFVLAAAGTRYAVAPWLWSDPAAVVDAFATLTRYSYHGPTLFQGEIVRWPSIPPHYLPTWMAITTPPAALLLALAGAAAVVRRGAARPRDMLRNTGLRFEWLLLACLTLPPAAVVALNSNLYNGWRQMYFLYAPLCLLAACGLRELLAAARRPWARRATGVLAAAALAGMAVDVVRLHPHQAAYFNFLVDRSTPERLRARYAMLYWAAEYREGLEYLLARHPDETLYVGSIAEWRLRINRAILPAAARDRIVLASEAGRADFFVTSFFPPPPRSRLHAPHLRQHRAHGQGGRPLPGGRGDGRSRPSRVPRRGGRRAAVPVAGVRPPSRRQDPDLGQRVVPPRGHLAGVSAGGRSRRPRRPPEAPPGTRMAADGLQLRPVRRALRRPMPGAAHPARLSGPGAPRRPLAPRSRRVAAGGDDHRPVRGAAG